MAAAKPKTPTPPECQAFVDVRQNPGVFLFLQESLSKRHVYRLRGLLNGKSYDQIDLVIYSGGGDIHAAYQLIALLRMHAKTVNACVPLFAKSAATLLCLGCDSIFLDEMAELGPLDTQILEEKRGGKSEFTSALNPFKTLEQLQKYSVETLDIGVKMVAARSGMDLNDCISHAIQFVGVTTGPLFNKLDPEKLGEYSRALAVGKDYAERLVRRYKQWDEDKRTEILERLVHGYPSHDYIIDYHELAEIGIEAHLFEGDQRTACRKLAGIMTKPDVFIDLLEPTIPSPPQEPGDAAK